MSFFPFCFLLFPLCFLRNIVFWFQLLILYYFGYIADFSQLSLLCYPPSIRENGGWQNWSMVQIERYEYNTKPELHARERHFIETLHAELNKVIPTRSKQEYRNDTKEHMKSYIEVNNGQLSGKFLVHMSMI